MFGIFKNLFNPLRDEQDVKPVCYCSVCGAEIYEDNGTDMCEDCRAMMEEEEEDD